MRNRIYRFCLPALLLMSLSGCAGPHQYPDGRHRSNILDAVFKRRHYDHAAQAPQDPAMAVARELTMIEDDLRRDGTITVKKPDVWGDGNLMYFLQEYDQQLAERTKIFDPTIQAYIARSDNMEVQGSTGLSAALGGQSGTAPTAVAQATPALISLPDVGVFDALGAAIAKAPPVVKGIGVEPTELARQHSTYIDVCQALRRRHMGDDNSRAAGYGLYKFRIPISVLPGRETNHGHSAIATLRAQLVVDEANLRYTFPRLAIADLVDSVAPLLRERWNEKIVDPEVEKLQTEIGDASSQIGVNENPIAAKFRTLQSSSKMDFGVRKKALLDLLNAPHGRPNQSFSFLAIQACDPQGKFLESLTFEQLKDDRLKAYAQATTQLKDYFRNLLTVLEKDVVDGKISIEMGKVALEEIENQAGPATKNRATPIAPRPSAIRQIYSIALLDSLRATIKDDVKVDFRELTPEIQELRAALFRHFGQVHAVLEEREIYSTRAHEIDCIAEEISLGNHQATETLRPNWVAKPLNDHLDPKIAESSWFLAVHVGLLNKNMKRILRALKHEDKVPDQLVDLIEDPQLQFYNLDSPLKEQTFALWETIIREEFPLHVFTLDSQVEEQNVYDAFSRRRELQLALAYNVAKGSFNMQQKIAMSRQLALDEATIALNRTVVGFAHGNDTFGWYFYPRVQTPPSESTNIGAFARTLWSTGPTEHYDMKHRNLEPGIRECEVLVAMPSFVNGVSFDVTTNWEKLAHPGVTKRSYEEMLAQGSRIHQLKNSLHTMGAGECYRPGDLQRLVSRADQLENMLGMQTYCVKVPFDFEQSGNDLFDQGRNKLIPVITGFYGLEFLKADDEKATEAHFFLTGKNFHPTLSHVITGGYESHGTSEGGNDRAEIEIINRQLVRVKVGKLNGALTDLKRGFQVRVGTPDGLSNPLRITPAAAPKPPPPPTPKGFRFNSLPQLTAKYSFCTTGESKLEIVGKLAADLVIDNTEDFPTSSPLLQTGKLIVVLTAADPAGKKVELGSTGQSIVTEEITIAFHSGRAWTFKGADLKAAIEKKLKDHPPVTPAPLTIAATGYVQFGAFPITQLLDPIVITVLPCEACKPAAGAEELPAPPPPASGSAPTPPPSLEKQSLFNLPLRRVPVGNLVPTPTVEPELRAVQAPPLLPSESVQSDAPPVLTIHD